MTKAQLKNKIQSLVSEYALANGKDKDVHVEVKTDYSKRFPVRVEFKDASKLPKKTLEKNNNFRMK